MKLGYGTYGMRGLDVFEVLPRLREIGYEGIELATGPDWTPPESFDAAARNRLRKLAQGLGFEAPVLMGGGDPCTWGTERKRVLDSLRRHCELVRDLHYGDGPAVITSVLGGRQPEWEQGKKKIADSLLEFGETVKEYGVVYAVEPHVGGALDTPEKAAWLIAEIDHPNVRLNFDISHFDVQGYDLRKAVETCAPLAVHTHVKDGYIDDTGLHFQLPGEGDFDYVTYMQAMDAAGFDGVICVEVSGMVWSAHDYDPWQAAEFCYATLSDALTVSGVND